ncbi:hypothetical protein BDV06DRAFT_48545 [Aspergillus oleicola]
MPHMKRLSLKATTRSWSPAVAPSSFGGRLNEVYLLFVLSPHLHPSTTHSRTIKRIPPSIATCIKRSLLSSVSKSFYLYSHMEIFTMS